jgi:DNA polymerase-3 subunit gamma/tau
MEVTPKPAAKSQGIAAAPAFSAASILQTLQKEDLAAQQGAPKHSAEHSEAPSSEELSEQPQSQSQAPVTTALEAPALQADRGIASSEIEAESESDVEVEVDVDLETEHRAAEMFSAPAEEFPEQPNVDAEEVAVEDAAPLKAQEHVALVEITSQSWPAMYAKLDLSGVAKSVISHCALESIDADGLHFVLEQHNAGLFNDAYTTKLQESLARLTGAAVQLTINIGLPTQQTPAQYMQAQAEARQAEAERLIQADPNVQMLMQRFDASIIPDSIQPISGEEKHEIR